MEDIWFMIGRGHARQQAARLHVVVCIFEGGAFLFTATLRMRKEFLSRQSLLWLRGRTIGALRAERHTLTSAEWTSCSACHELPCSRAFLFIVLWSAQHPQIPRFLQFFRGIWPMPLSLLNHSALALSFFCSTHAHCHFCPQHWLLCHLGLY